MNAKQTVLVIEDEFVNRAILKKILSDEYNVIEAENGKVGWEIFIKRKSEITAVLLDVIMPVMDGYQFLEEMRNANISDIPVIVTTGSSDTESEQKVLEAGAWDFTSKPYNAQVLVRRLANAIARSREAALEELKYMAEHDKLTSLYNRRHMFAKTASMLENNGDKKFGFLRIDIDRFSLFNASFGEAEGDKLLKHMAGCIKDFAETYSVSTYGRVGSDVFCICFEYDGDAKLLYDRILAIQKKLSSYRKDYTLEISSGFCTADDKNLAIDDFYFRATTAAAKCKNQYETHLAFYDETSGKQLATELAITSEMQTALDEKQFVVYLQPKFSLCDDKICGAEALVRWIHPEKGLISPGAFIPVFEKNGFISKVDYYVWERTCQLLRQWIDEGRKPVPISVNISRISLYNPKLTQMMKDLIKKYNIPAYLFQLEITESAYMTNPELMEDTIASLHDAGFIILMDDFGSGYSSLNTLKRIKVDVLKLDMKFLPVKEETERGEIILACVIKMANWLGMEVVVEGVETRRQRDFLEGAGAESVQGFYYSRPIPSKDYEELYLTEKQEIVEDDDFSSDETKKIVPKHNMTVLVIDDSEYDRTLLGVTLENLFHVHMCDSGEAGLAYAKHNHAKIKLILVDNLMPGMTGLEFLNYCNEDPELKVIPKMMITANESVSDQVDAFNAGAYDYLTKPLAKEIVLARVNHVMQITRQASIYDEVEVNYLNNSRIDAQTGLLNKMAYHDLASEIIHTSQEDDHALMLIDIDNFGLINETFGRDIGDVVIKSVAADIKNALRKTDLAGCFGGDEFLVLMTRIGNRDFVRNKATEIIRNISIACAKKFNVEVGLSIGVSFFEKNDSYETMFARADQALYVAKTTGKDKVVIYGETVPEILGDDKPIVMVCSSSERIYPAIAFAYGKEAAFTQITSYDGLIETFEKYRERIKVVLLDTQENDAKDAFKFYQYLVIQGCGKDIPIVAMCPDGDMDKMRSAMELDVSDILTVPLQNDIVARKISKFISRKKF